MVNYCPECKYAFVIKKDDLCTLCLSYTGSDCSSIALPIDQCRRCDTPLNEEEGEICDICLVHGDFEDDDPWMDYYFNDGND